MKSLKPLLFVFGLVVLFSFRNHLGPPQVDISLTEMNMVYIGIENPITIHSEQIDQADLRVKVVGGSILSDGQKGQYLLKPSVGVREMTVHIAEGTGSGNRALLKEKFRVRRLPMPRAQLGGIPNDGLPKSKAAIKAQTVLIASMGPGFSYNLRYRISSYECMVLSETKRQTFSVRGSALTDEIKELVANSVAGDIIMFTGIKATETKYGFNASLAPVVVKVR